MQDHYDFVVTNWLMTSLKRPKLELKREKNGIYIQNIVAKKEQGLPSLYTHRQKLSNS